MYTYVWEIQPILTCTKNYGLDNKFSICETELKMCILGGGCSGITNFAKAGGEKRGVRICCKARFSLILAERACFMK